MALATYNDFLAEVPAYMGRTDALMLARFPTFMQAAEARIYNGYGMEGDPLYSEALRCALMEVTGTVAVAAGSGALPADYLAQRALYIAGTLDQPAFEPAQRFFSETLNAGFTQPSYYTIVGQTIRVSGNWTGSLSLVYFKKFPDVTAAAQTHALVTAYPMIWLHALLLEANEWSRNDAGAARYIGKLRANIEAVNGVATEQRYGGPSQMTMRIDPIG